MSDERLDFAKVAGPLDTELVAYANLLDREPPKTRDATSIARTLLRYLVLVSDNTYHTMRFFCADEPKGEKPKSEYALSAPPLARTVLDALCTVIFLFEDLEARVTWYFKSGWREYAEEHQRLLEAYGADHQWTTFFLEHAAVVDNERIASSVTPQEQANPARLVPWWPIPGQMVSHNGTSQARRDYLKYLNDWFYRELSQDSHLSWRGLARRVAYLALPRDNASWDRVQKQKSDTMFTTIILLVAMLSEIEVALGYDRKDRIVGIWDTIIPFSKPAEELFNLHYRGRF